MAGKRNAVRRKEKEDKRSANESICRLETRAIEVGKVGLPVGTALAEEVEKAAGWGAEGKEVSFRFSVLEERRRWGKERSAHP